jgi:hypothetical protein
MIEAGRVNKLLAYALVLVLASGLRIARAGDIAADEARRMMAFFDKIVAATVADQDSCPKMATDLQALIDANQAVIAAAQKARAEGKKLPPDAQKHMIEKSKEMMPAAQKCRGNKHVATQFQRLHTAGPATPTP